MTPIRPPARAKLARLTQHCQSPLMERRGRALMLLGCVPYERDLHHDGSAACSAVLKLDCHVLALTKAHLADVHCGSVPSGWSLCCSEVPAAI